MSRIFGRRRADERAWRRALARTVPAAEVDGLLQAVRARASKLARQVPAPPGSALAGHLHDNIAPGAALYLELRSRLGQKRALQVTADAFTEAMRARARPVKLLDRLPGFFSLFRVVGRRTMRRDFPPPGFEVRWVGDDATAVAFDIRRCYYLDTLRSLGVAELAPLFCRNDDLLFGELRRVTWRRTGTLATGACCCDFRFTAPGRSSARAGS